MSHDRIACLFDQWAREGRAEGMERGHRPVAMVVLDQLDVRPGEQILDLGCGNGWATRILAQKAPGVGAVGIDVSPAMIQRAEEQSSLRIRARYEVGRFESLDLPDERFDRAFSMEALYYATDLGRALGEVHRVLKAGAPFDAIIDCYAEREATRDWPEQLGLELHVLSEAQWHEAFERAGFSRVRTSRVHDPEGPSKLEDFQPTVHLPDWETARSYHEAGSLWIHGEARK